MARGKVAQKDDAQLARIYKALGDRLDFTLAQLVKDEKPIAPALATAAANYLKLHKVGEQIAEDSDQEQAAAAMQNFVPRPGVLDDDNTAAYDDPREQEIIEQNRRALDIKPVEWSPEELRAVNGTSTPTTKEK